MYHGTSAAAAKAIKQSGFHPSSGGMLGKGVYLSRDIQKARAYAKGIDGKILRCRVNTGRVKKIDKQGHPLQRGWQGTYDSAWVPPHCGMVPSGLTETCVADPSRITVLGCTT
jgi:RNA:NAD 2'-phosphotransferase (TPT1/KptA family)